MTELIALVEENFESAPQDENSVVLELNPAYQHLSRVPMIYSEEFRPIEDPRETMLTVWLGNIAPNLTPDQIKALFNTEVLFADGESEYWMPIQTPVLEYLKDEFKAGDEVVLYVVYLGATHGEDAPEYVFVINEYEWE